MCGVSRYSAPVIKSFRHKGLKELFLKGHTPKIRLDLQRRSLARLGALDHATEPEDLNVHGFHFHGLHGRAKRYSIRVSGPWRIASEWIDGNAWRVDLEQYH